LLDRELIELEKDPGNRETLSSIFRTMHTIQGTSGFLGFLKLEQVAHAGENLLSLLRDGVIHITTERTTALPSLVDAIRQMLDSIEETETDSDRDDRALIETPNRLQKDHDPCFDEESCRCRILRRCWILLLHPNPSRPRALRSGETAWENPRRVGEPPFSCVFFGTECARYRKSGSWVEDAYGKY